MDGRAVSRGVGNCVVHGRHGGGMGGAVGLELSVRCGLIGVKKVKG